jgi:hypothetical protein
MPETTEEIDMYTTDKGFKNLISRTSPIRVHETVEAAASAGDGLAFLTGIPGNDDLEESAEQMIVPQRTENVPAPKEVDIGNMI